MLGLDRKTSTSSICYKGREVARSTKLAYSPRARAVATVTRIHSPNTANKIMGKVLFDKDTS